MARPRARHRCSQYTGGAEESLAEGFTHQVVIDDREVPEKFIAVSVPSLFDLPVPEGSIRHHPRVRTCPGRKRPAGTGRGVEQKKKGRRRPCLAGSARCGRGGATRDMAHRSRRRSSG